MEMVGGGTTPRRSQVDNTRAQGMGREGRKNIIRFSIVHVLSTLLNLLPRLSQGCKIAVAM